ncbi:acyltransferase family protein [Streptomyces sp. NPDC001732]
MDEARPRPDSGSVPPAGPDRPFPRPAGGAAGHIAEHSAGRALVERLHSAVLRFDEASPASRDRAIDVLRAFAVLGVMLGHWLVSAVVLRASGHLTGDSPLHYLPGFTPLTWLLQPLAVFFFVGGWSGARSHRSATARGGTHRGWLARRARLLLRPTAGFVATWSLVLLGLALTGVAFETIRTLLMLALSPLWFLGVYLLLTVATPLIRRYAGRCAVVAFLVVVTTDTTYRLSDGAEWADLLHSLNVPAGWLVPYALGAFCAANGLGRRGHAVGMLVGGAAVTAVLTLYFGYPASMVGVPGTEVSNLDPPSLAAVCFGVAQCGAGLLLCGPIRRLVGRPEPSDPDPGTSTAPAPGAASGVAPDPDSDPGAARVGGRGRAGEQGPPRATARQFCWAGVALLNLSALTVFLWHQTAMLTTTVVSLAFGDRLLGLHTVPDTVFWVLTRLAWLPVFAAVLTACWVAFRDLEFKARSSAQ